MSSFGFVSSLLKVPSWNFFDTIIPDKLRYWHGPLKAGQITGILPQDRIRGWGWKLPESTAEIWSNSKKNYLWQRFLAELQEQDIKILGLDPETLFYPSVINKNQYGFPGVSDGKALELLLFISRFSSILRNYDIPPQKAKAMIIWEEGNLGLTCARLVAREVRFLALVSPNEKNLERAAELVFAETGVSPQTYSEVPNDYRGARIIIKCGRLNKIGLSHCPKRMLRYELFQRSPSISSMNVSLPISVRYKLGELPLYPALGEAIIRSYFDLNYGFWFGNDLPLERIIKLAVCFKGLGREIAV